jgi:hypothetical protein
MNAIIDQQIEDRELISREKIVIELDCKFGSSFQRMCLLDAIDCIVNDFIGSLESNHRDNDYKIKVKR